MGMLLGLCVLLALASGCRKKRSTAPPEPVPTPQVEPTPPPVTSESPPPARAQAPSGPLKPSNIPPEVEFLASTAFRDLSTGLQLFVSDKKRFPADVQELKAAGYLPNGVPTPPPGKQYEIDRKNKQVVLR